MDRRKDMGVSSVDPIERLIFGMDEPPQPLRVVTIQQADRLIALMEQQREQMLVVLRLLTSPH